MCSVPVHAIPKPESDTLRLVVDHSAGDFSPNSRIDKDDIAGVRLDGIQSLGANIRAYRQQNADEQLVVWKSDVSEAYRLCPMHPLWQIKQVVCGLDGLKYVDRCNNFGGRGSQKVYYSLASLVVWIAVFERGLQGVKCYVDDHFGVSRLGDNAWYSPYAKSLPKDQVALLKLFDELGIPHAEKKQVSGSPLWIIGFDVDPNLMSISMCLEKRAKLAQACEPFLKAGTRLPLKDFWALEGHVNWSLNVFPLLRPALSAMYAKTAGKTKPQALLRVNTSIAYEMQWFLSHVEKSTGVHLIEAIEWTTHDRIDTLEAYTDASGVGIGIWFPGEHVAYQWEIPVQLRSNQIFFFEALAVCCAAHLSRFHGSAKRLLCHTDNSNSFDIFHSLRAKPSHNCILMSTVDVRIKRDLDMRVTWIPGEDNLVADAISRLDDDRVHRLAPNVEIIKFQPPRDALGADKK